MKYACQVRDPRFSKDKIDLERVAICRSWPASWLPEGGTTATMSCYICSSLSPSAKLGLMLKATSQSQASSSHQQKQQEFKLSAASYQGCLPAPGLYFSTTSWRSTFTVLVYILAIAYSIALDYCYIEYILSQFPLILITRLYLTLQLSHS